MKNLIIITISAFTLFTSVNAAESDSHATELTESARNTAALKALQSNPRTIQVYAKGLVCESCALGIRMKVKKLKFVDSKQPESGVILDVKSQLISITPKSGSQIDTAALTKSIKGAGYEPVTLFMLDKNSKLTATSLAN